MPSSQPEPLSELTHTARRHWRHWWPILLGPAMMLFVYLAKCLQWTWFLSKPLHETLATHLMSAAVACYLILAWRSGNPVHKLLAVLSIIFLGREIHFHGAKPLTYAALALLGVWVWLWRERVRTGLAEGRLRVWVFSTAATYVLSVLVARRILKGIGLDYEIDMRCWTEESLENTAHVMLIITAFSDRFGRRKATGTEQENA